MKGLPSGTEHSPGDNVYDFMPYVNIPFSINVEITTTLQSVPIATNVVSSNPDQARCTRYNIM